MGELGLLSQHLTNVIPRVATKPPVGISQNARGVLRGMFAPNFYEAKVTLCQTSWDKTRYCTTPSASCLGRDPYGRLCCRPLDDVNEAVVRSLQKSFLQRQLPHKSKSALTSRLSQSLFPKAFERGAGENCDYREAVHRVLAAGEDSCLKSFPLPPPLPPPSRP